MGWSRCEERRISNGKAEFYQARNAAGMRAFQHLVCKSTAKTAKKINNNN